MRTPLVLIPPLPILGLSWAELSSSPQESESSLRLCSCCVSRLECPLHSFLLTQTQTSCRIYDAIIQTQVFSFLLLAVALSRLVQHLGIVVNMSFSVLFSSQSLYISSQMSFPGGASGKEPACQLGSFMCLQSVWQFDRQAERCWSQLILHVLELLLIASGPCVSSRLVRLHQHGSCCCLVAKSCPPPLRFHGLQPARLLCP